IVYVAPSQIDMTYRKKAHWFMEGNEEIPAPDEEVISSLTMGQISNKEEDEN
ncbi:hypothetical protein Trydic_g3741, partial [Trypoxylus dichotomus]